MLAGWIADWAEIAKVGGALLVAWVPAIAALLWQRHTWKKRLPDTLWIETMKGDVRRDVEQTLAAQETRLRVGADLQLRLHEKSWDLMREILAAATDAYWATLDYAMFVANHPERIRDASGIAEREKRYEKSLAAIGKLDVLCATAPPNHPLKPVRLAYRDAFSATNDLLFDGPTQPKERGRELLAIQGKLAHGLAMAGGVCKRWNDDLWGAAEKLPSGIVEPAGAPARVRVAAVPSDQRSSETTATPDAELEELMGPSREAKAKAEA